MKRLLFLLSLFLVFQITQAQTTLIDPAGDGGFDNGATPAANNWTAVNSSTDAWVVGGVPVASNGANCGFVSSNGGAAWTYSQLSVIQHLYYDVTIPAGQSKITLTFKWKVGGEGSGTSDWDNMKVFWGLTSAITPVANTAIAAGFQFSGSGAVSGMYKLNSASWNSETINLTGVPGSTYRLVFSWKSDGSDIVNPPAAIDEISLVANAPVPLVGGTIYPINNVNNPPVEFSNITNAIAYIAGDGVTGTGQVIFELGASYAGTEPAPVNIPVIPGAGASLGVTIRPATSVTALTSIAGTASPNQHAIQITGSHITLDGRAGGAGSGRDWTVRNTGTTNGHVSVRINNPAPITGINVRNLIMESNVTGTTAGILQIGTSSTAANTISNVVIEENMIRSEATTSIRGYGITTGSASSSTSNTGLVIRNNEITRIATNGIRLTAGFPGQEVYGNQIYFSEPHAGSSEFAGIYFSTSSAAGTKIYNNYIYDIRVNGSSSTAINGIQIVVSNSTGDIVSVFNNRISIGQGITMTTVPIYGINYSSTTNTYPYNIYFNSVRITGTATTGSQNSAAFRKAGGNVLNLRNNIFYNARTNTGGTGKHFGIMVNSNTFTAIGYNDYFADGSGGVLGNTTGVTPAGDQTTLSAWQTAVPTDVGSVSQNPNFLAGLVIDATIPTQLESGGVPIAGITTDFQGDARNVTSPDIGADEFAGIALDLTPPTIVYSALANTSSTAARNLVVTVTDFSGVPTVTPGWPNLYWRINAGSWTAATPTGVAGSDYTYSFGAGVVLGDVVEYYVVAQDNASTPNVGAFPSAGAGGFTTNPPAAATPPTTPSSYTIVAGIGGALTVGTGGDYPTLTGAGGLFADINAKVLTGNITATILSDLTEDGTNALNQWSEDAPGSFTLTIKPNTATTPLVSGTYAGGLIRLNGADRVTIDGSNSGGADRSLTIQNNSAVANTAAIQIISLGSNAGATDNTIKNCNIKAGEIGSTTSLNTFGIYVGEAAISTTGTGADNDDLTIQNNAISKARYGIYARATGTTNANDNLLITGNEIGSADPLEYVTFRGIDLTYAQGPVVSQNTIFNLKTTLSASNAGMDFGSGVNDAVITRNNITGVYSESTSGYGAYGINFSSSTSVNNNLIANNTISDIRTVNYSSGSTTFNAFGIRLVGGTNTSLYYNSVSLTGNITIVSGSPTQPNSSPLVVTSTTVTGLNMVNNVFSNQQSFVSGTPKTYSVWFPTSYAGFGTVNYNDYYGTTSAPGTYYVGRVGSTDYATLLDWQGFTTQDANSIGADPQFVSETNLQPFTGSPVLAAGTPIVGITTDYTGASRSGTTPAIGAYESGQAAAAVGWANLQWPPNATITEGQTFTAYARVWQDGVTPGPGPGAGIESWFGWSATNTDPATWSNWISGTYNADYGNDDEWMADIGAGITPGTYYYASRFRTTGGTYQYGGYSGGFWNGTTNVSGVLTVNPFTVTSLPWYESFEGVWTPTGWANSLWDNSKYGGARTGTKWAFSNTTGSLLTTPGVVIPASGNYQFSFWHRNESASYPQNLNVFLSTNGVDFTVPVATIVGAASTTYTQVVFDLSAYNGQTVYFRFNGLSGAGGFDYGICVDDIEVKPSATTWLGASNIAWDNAANWSNGVPVGVQNAIIGVSANNPVLGTAASVNDLTIDNGAVLSVTNGGQLTVNGALTNSAGNTGLVLQSNASGTGSLIHNTANVPATIKRYITGGQYHFASVPLTAAANPTADVFLHSYLWRYDPTLPDWVKYLNEADPLTVTQGYMLWYTGANTTYSFAGNMNNGAFTAVTPGGAGTFNLVPNPYPSAINWTAATGWTKTNVDNAIYIYNNNQYASYVGGVGTNGGTNFIPVGQAFFVQATGAATLAMNNNVRVHSTQAYFNEPVINDLFRIAVSVNGKTDETVVRFTESATASFDGEFDAVKLYGHASAPQLYTMAADNQMLSINSLSMTEGGVSVPLSFEFSANGEITLQFSGVGSFNEQQAIFLEDLATGSLTNLRQHGSYSFNHLVSNDSDRFLLHFRDITGVDEQGNGWMIFASDRKVYVNIPELNGQRASIEMFDVLGIRLYSSEGVLNSPTVVRAMNSGVAVVRVTAQGRVYTTKLFIQ